MTLSTLLLAGLLSQNVEGFMPQSRVSDNLVQRGRRWDSLLSEKNFVVEHADSTGNQFAYNSSLSDPTKEILLESISAMEPNEVLGGINLDVSEHELIGDTKYDASKNEDLQAVLQASSEAALAAEASLPKEIIEQFEFSANANPTTYSEPSNVVEVPEILSASSVVGEPITKIEAPSTSKILKFAIPAIGVWLCGPILSLIDTSAVGLLSGTVQQAALSPAVAVTDYAALLIAFMYTGATNLVAAAQESDKGTIDKPRTAKTLIGAMRLSTFVGVGLGAILFAFAKPFLRAIIGNDSISPAVFAAAVKYVRIRALGMPAAAIIGSTQAACLGMQDIRSPLYVLVAAAVVNFFGDMLFVGNGHHLIGGAAGAAWATIASQYAGLALFVWWLSNKPKSSVKPRVMNLSNPILEITGKVSGGGTRRRRLQTALSAFSLNSRGETRFRSSLSFNKFLPKKINVPKKQSQSDNFSVRGFLENRFSAWDLLKPPSADTRKEFAPYLAPVTATQVGRVSGYIAMSHVVASSLGTVSMAAQQVIVSLFYCLCPIADSLSLTAQSFIPSISEKKPSPEKAAALRKTALNFGKAGLVFGAAMLLAVSGIPLFSGCFTSDPIVSAMVNSVVPLLLAFFSVHGVLCAFEGVMLGQKDLGFVGKMYALFFFAVPFFELRVKRAALAGIPVGLTSVWTVFVGYQAFRLAAWVGRVGFLQLRTNKEAASIPELAP